MDRKSERSVEIGIIIVAVLLFLSFIIAIVLSVGQKGNDSIQSNLKHSYELKAEEGTENGLVQYGSAVRIDENIFISNYHLVKRESHEFKTFSVRDAYSSSYTNIYYLKGDPSKDLAFFSIDKDDTKIPKFSNFKCRDDYRMSDEVYCLSNFENHGLSYSKGYVSKREVHVKSGIVEGNFLQLDISISDGSSGGGVFNHDGAFIGLIAFRLNGGAGETTQGYAYAIPYETIHNVLSHLFGM